MSLVHIPLQSYSSFLHAVLKLLFPLNEGETTIATGPSVAAPRRNLWATRHTFLNVSITPIECSVVCDKSLAREFFAPLQEDQYRLSQREATSTSAEDYVVLQVDGEGLDAGQRVLELTTPLAMAGV